MVVTLTHCSPSMTGRTRFLATFLSMAERSSLLYLRYPLTSEMVLDGIGGDLMTLTFHPDSFFRADRISWSLMALGLMASTKACPVSGWKLMSVTSAESGIMERIFFSTLSGSSRVDGSGLMSTLLLTLMAMFLATSTFPENSS